MSTIAQRRPSKGTETGRVWDIADELTRRKGTRAKRAEVVKAFVEEGGNPNTGATQYQAWKSSYDASRSGTAMRTPADRYCELRVKEGGRILLPVELREQLGVEEGEVLVGHVDDGELRLMTRRTAVRKIQEMVRQHVPPGVSLVDELIAERRAEAARENGD